MEYSRETFDKGDVDVKLSILRDISIDTQDSIKALKDDFKAQPMVCGAIFVKRLHVKYIGFALAGVFLTLGLTGVVAWDKVKGILGKLLPALL